MADLIIHNKFEKRLRSSVVINIAMETKTEIERLALASGHSFNEIAEMLIDFALPHCKLADLPADDKPAAEPPKMAIITPKETEEPKAKASPAPAKATPAAKPSPAPAAKTAAPAPAAKTAAPAPAAKTAAPAPAAKTAAPRTVALPKTSTAEKTVVLPKTAAAPAAKPKIDKPIAAEKTVSKDKPKDALSQVPTFKLPPITTTKTPTKKR